MILHFVLGRGGNNVVTLHSAYSLLEKVTVVATMNGEMPATAILIAGHIAAR